MANQIQQRETGGGGRGEEEDNASLQQACGGRTAITCGAYVAGVALEIKSSF